MKLYFKNWKDPKCVPIADEIKIVENYMPSNHDASRVVDIDGIAPTVKENHGTVTAIAEPFVIASRGRYVEDNSTEQHLEPNFTGCTNTITSVQKDNYIAEQVVYDDYNSRIPQDQEAITTLTTNCGASAPRNGVKILEPIVCEERTDEGIRFFKDGVCGTLRTISACGDKRVIEYNIKWRIRKLIERECWKLMGFTSEDCNRASQFVSNSALYKQAGNSICTSCLIAIFYSLIFNDSSAEWSKYLVQNS